MKKLIIYTFILSSVYSCQKSIQIPELNKPDIPDSSISERGIIDANLVTENPVIKYIKKYDQYIFTISLPAIKTDSPSDYIWHIDWYYLLKQKDGLKSLKNTSTITLTPIDFLSVQTEVYCENKYTGVKSKTFNSVLIVNLTGSKSKVNKK